MTPSQPNTESTSRGSHLSKLEAQFFINIERRDDCEYGSIGLDCKRPFGNSDVEGDILEIIGAEMEGDDGSDKCWSSEQRDYAAGLYNDLAAHITAKAKLFSAAPELLAALKAIWELAHKGALSMSLDAVEFHEIEMMAEAVIPKAEAQ